MPPSLLYSFQDFLSALVMQDYSVGKLGLYRTHQVGHKSLHTLAGCTQQPIIALEQGKYVSSIELTFRIASVFWGSTGGGLSIFFKVPPRY